MHNNMKIAPGTEDRNLIGTTPLDNQVIPVMSTGEKPKVVYLAHDGAGSDSMVRIVFGNATAVVTASTGALIPAHYPLCFDVAGYDRYAIVGTAANIDITVVPLENF